jgi:hypothetical protein
LPPLPVLPVLALLLPPPQSPVLLGMLPHDLHQHSLLPAFAPPSIMIVRIHFFEPPSPPFADSLSLNLHCLVCCCRRISLSLVPSPPSHFRDSLAAVY